MKKHSLPTIPIEELPEISQLVQEVKKSDTPVLITKDGKADTVAMSLPVYKALFGQFEACEKVLEGVQEERGRLHKGNKTKPFGTVKTAAHTSCRFFVQTISR